MVTELESWQKPGKIAAEALQYGKTLLKENINLFEIATKIEEFIEKHGAKLAFPVQISINNIGAHHTPNQDEEITIKKGDLVKLDLGVHIDGYIGDTALTLEIGTNNYKKIIETNEKALNEAIKLCKPGTKLREIGKAISNAIPEDLHVIRNLTGHKVEQYNLHGEFAIPNYDNKDETELKIGDIIAIEPHVSNGIGLIREGKLSNNYKLESNNQTRDIIARTILDYIKKEFITLPFATRYLTKKFPPGKVNYALAILEKQGILSRYHELPEKDPNAVVSQFEHTIYIDKEPIILTKL